MSLSQPSRTIVVEPVRVPAAAPPPPLAPPAPAEKPPVAPPVAATAAKA